MNDKTTMTKARDAILHMCHTTRSIAGYDGRLVQDALAALSEALAPPTRKPASWLTTDGKFSHVETPGAIPLYRFEEANHEST